jgi:hypothetical protein
MTSRSTTLMFIALVMLASLAVAAPAAPNGAPASPAPPAVSGEASAPCDSLLARLETISPRGSATTSDYPDCGPCSDLACRGLSIYDFCGGTLQKPKRCKASGYQCFEVAMPKCLCLEWTLP